MRSGTHSEEGAYSLERWLLFHAAHTHEHAAQIRALRLARLGQAPPPSAPSRAPRRSGPPLMPPGSARG